MTKRNETLKRGGPFAAGVLIGLSVVTPAFAASLDVETLQPLVLLGSLILLLIGLILKAMSPRGFSPCGGFYPSAKRYHCGGRRASQRVRRFAAESMTK